MLSVVLDKGVYSKGRLGHTVCLAPFFLAPVLVAEKIVYRIIEGTHPGLEFFLFGARKEAYVVACRNNRLHEDYFSVNLLLNNLLKGYCGGEYGFA